ncbi:MAG: hypothetical protein QOG51_1587 [Verrucomicrobiota bacterium]|jgi:hypothetical protein
MTKARRITGIAFALLLLSFTVAAKKPKAAASADFFPLRVGDSWTYRNTSDSSQYTLKVLNEEKQADGSSRYEMEMLAGVIVRKFFSKPAGWVLLHFERYPEHEGLEAKYEPAKQYLQNPLVPGFKWGWKGKDYTQTDVTENSQVIGFEKVSVPAGKFRAMKVVSQVTGGAAVMTKTYWYADGVGLVKTTTEAGTINYASELIDYSFKNKSAK